MTRRLPLGLLIGGVVAVLLLVAGTGAALALMLGGDDDPPRLPSPGLAAAATPAPVSTPTPATPAPDSTPTTATPAPVSTPTTATPGPTPTPGNGGTSTGSQVIDVENLRIEVPADWEVLSQEPHQILVKDPETPGLLRLQSVTTDAEITLEGLQDAIVEVSQETSPDAKLCGGDPSPGPVPGGPRDGVSFLLCYTVTPDGGEAFPGVSYYILGVQGQTFFLIELFAHDDRFDAFGDKVFAVPPIWTLTWKLYEQP